MAGSCPYNLFGGKTFYCDVYALRARPKKKLSFSDKIWVGVQQVMLANAEW